MRNILSQSIFGSSPKPSFSQLLQESMQKQNVVLKFASIITTEAPTTTSTEATTTSTELAPEPKIKIGKGGKRSFKRKAKSKGQAKVKAKNSKSNKKPKFRSKLRTKFRRIGRKTSKKSSSKRGSPKSLPKSNSFPKVFLKNAKILSNDILDNASPKLYNQPFTPKKTDWGMWSDVFEMTPVTMASATTTTTSTAATTTTTTATNTATRTMAPTTIPITKNNITEPINTNKVILEEIINMIVSTYDKYEKRAQLWTLFKGDQDKNIDDMIFLDLVTRSFKRRECQGQVDL